MEKKYREIEFLCGWNIERAVIELLEYKEKGELVCGEFNGHMLYSDTVTMDSAYLEITGKNKNMDYTCENCKLRHTWDCDDGGVMRKCSDFELDESTLSSEEQRLLRVMRQVMSEKS